MSSDDGFLLIFLHAHLPYVRHPEDDNILEEDWLYEAITGTYIPLLTIADGWRADRIPARITISMTPTLLEMLSDELLINRYTKRIRSLIRLAELEVKRNKDDERFRFTSEMYRDRFTRTLDVFENKYARNLVDAFGALLNSGIVELVTSAATHAFLPGFEVTPAQIRAQIRSGVRTYRDHFGQEPPGMWLPECGFVPGIDRFLADEGIQYFICDSHSVLFSDPKPAFGTTSPLVCPSGVVAFPRDLESSAQVWSSEFGYPGDGRYREFYRDLGHDLSDDPSLSDFRLGDGAKRNVGIKYHRVTDRGVPLHEKQPYHRGWAIEAVEQHAEHFVEARSKQIESRRRVHGRSPVILAPYDAELFGHWWFEGPEFLDQIVRRSTRGDSAYRLATPTEVMGTDMAFQVAMPAPTSWGAYGYSDTWLNETNQWIWPLVHHVSERMQLIASNRPNAEGLERRALNQLARQALLVSASDWPFILTMGTMQSYARRRVSEHLSEFDSLWNALVAGHVDEGAVIAAEERDPIFRTIDYRDFSVGS